jgi:pimeloyl-ACP methyl ester carboxylesterase
MLYTKNSKYYRFKRNQALKLKTLIHILALLILSQNLSALTTAETAPMKNCDGENPKECFNKKNEANWAFQFHHGYQTKYVALLIHGLSDSPYYFKDIAPVFYNRSMNVLAIRLTGHGTTPKDLLSLSYKDWIKDVEWGMRKAKKMGKKVILAGFSTGGALAVHQALTKKESIHGLFLFSAAFAIRDSAKYLCSIANINWANKTYGNGVRYPYYPSDSVCELYKLILNQANPSLRGGKSIDYSKIYSESSNFKFFDIFKDGAWSKFSYHQIRNFQKLKLPVFGAFSFNDDTLNFDKTFSLLSSINGPRELILFGERNLDIHIPMNSTYAPGPKLRHSFIMLKNDTNLFTIETNPQFWFLERRLKRFLRDIYSKARPL